MGRMYRLLCAFRDVELEKEVLAEAQKIGLGAQFGVASWG